MSMDRFSDSEGFEIVPDSKKARLKRALLVAPNYRRRPSEDAERSSPET